MSASLPPRDIALLLRAHSEQRWLSREVIPVVRQIETGERLPEEQLPAAIAYLEVIWAEALALARAADTALHALDTPAEASCEPPPAAPAHGPEPPPAALAEPPPRARACAPEPPLPALAYASEPLLPARARRYHTAVRTLREAAAHRVAALLAAPAELGLPATDRRFGGLPIS